MARTGRWLVLGMVAGAALLPAFEAEAIPYFARRLGVGCNLCHDVVPKLNETGMAFRAQGYVLPEREMSWTFPVAAWVSARVENRPDRDVSKLFVDKVELISGGRIGGRASYFVEWRTVSLGLQPDGSLSDRSGRFEDAFVAVDLTDNLLMSLGQYRLFDQFDVSLRLSASEPVALSSGVAGVPKAGDSARQAALRGFAPAARSPAVRLTYRLPTPGLRAHNGWTFHASLPFPGELSLPLTAEARRRASFELDLDPKGIYLEGYYRRGLSSLGGAAFLGEGRQLYTALASWDPGRWNSTLAVSSAVVDGVSDRRLSWWNEWHIRRGLNLGVRVDDTDFSPTSVHLYGDIQWASRRGVLWLLLEQQLRSGDDRTIVQLNAVF